MKKILLSSCGLIIIGLTIFLTLKPKETYAVTTTLVDTVIAEASKTLDSAAYAGNGTGNFRGVYGTHSYTDNEETKYHEYRYVGANVDNFVKFNNDIYRIIGVFDGNSHGQSGYLVKLIRAKSLISSSWGNYNKTVTNIYDTYNSYANDWTGTTTGVKANLNVLLNEYFLNKTDTSEDYGACSNWTYYSSNNNNYKTNDCSKIVGYGIDNTYRNYIEDVTWYLKGYNSNAYSKGVFYTCERDITGNITGCNSANNRVYAATTEGKIGLMYVSDYAYASGYYAELNTTILGSSYYGNKNWLYNGYEWTITPCSGNATSTFFVGNNGGMYGNYAYFGFASRPSFYLKSSVYVTGGSGSLADPYTIACDDCDE